MAESSARSDRDRRSRSRLELDALEGHELATYRSGVWLGPPVKSEQLRRRAYVRDRGVETDVAELAARSRVQAERLAAG